ncbi:hypothetical protein PENTCL1PPCAC_12594, partial [Pristionchus entomophagus]
DPRPCLNVADLWDWKPPGGPRRTELCLEEGDAQLPHHPTRVPPIEKLRREHTPKRQSQLVVCHDYGGDLPRCDRWDGCSTADCTPFLFTHWWHMDTFCYFGHKMVTIPPASFTSLAHRHGVAVLGTLIFEHQSGSAALTEILSTETNMTRTVTKLVEIMKTWRFDGWLVNVEVEIEVREVSLLLSFLAKLKKATKMEDPNATIMWYDAVCTDGKLEWQNTLNERNMDFYNVCDSIFLNYKWTPKGLETCMYNQGAATVCVGIDVWGRSGGKAKWETHESITKILRKSLSVALFAPGWAVEADENTSADPQENSNKFWSSLSHVMNTRLLDLPLPFSTTFRNGYSQNGKFFRLCDMDLMPHLAYSKKLLIPTERGLLIKQSGRHLLWSVKEMMSNSDLRVQIRTEGPGSVTIKLGRREMKLERLEEDGTKILRPENGECAPFPAIFVVTSEPGVVLTYFEMYLVETERCLD